MEPIGSLASLSLRDGKSRTENNGNEKTAEKAAFAIFNSFRKSDADNPEIYLAACIRVLSAYPEDIMRAVADPITGIAGKQTFLPSIAELKDALDQHMAPILARQKQEAEIARTRKIIDEGQVNHTPGEAERVMARATMFREEMTARNKTDKQREQEAWQKKFNHADDNQQKQMLHHLRLDVTPAKIGPDLAKKLARMANGSDADDHRMF